MTWVSGRSWSLGPARSTSHSTSPPRRFPTIAHVSLSGTSREQTLDAGATECSFKAVPANAGPGRLEAWVQGNRARAGVLGVTALYTEK